MDSILSRSGPIPDDDEDEVRPGGPASILSRAGAIPDDDEPSTGGDPRAVDSASSSTPVERAAPENTGSDDSQRIGSPKMQGTLEDIGRDLDAHPPKDGGLNVAGESPMMKRLNERGPDESASAGIIRGTVGVPLSIIGTAGEAGQDAMRGDYEGAMAKAAPTALALGASAFPMGRAVVGGMGALRGLGQMLTAKTPADVTEGGVNAMGGAAMGAGAMGDNIDAARSAMADAVSSGKKAGVIPALKDWGLGKLEGVLRPRPSNGGQLLTPSESTPKAMRDPVNLRALLARPPEPEPTGGLLSADEVNPSPPAARQLKPMRPEARPSGALLSPEESGAPVIRDPVQLRDLLPQPSSPSDTGALLSPEEASAAPAPDRRLKPMRALGQQAGEVAGLTPEERVASPADLRVIRANLPPMENGAPGGLTPEEAAPASEEPQAIRANLPQANQGSRGGLTAEEIEPSGHRGPIQLRALLPNPPQQSPAGLTPQELAGSGSDARVIRANLPQINQGYRGGLTPEEIAPVDSREPIRLRGMLPEPTQQAPAGLTDQELAGPGSDSRVIRTNLPKADQGSPAGLTPEELKGMPPVDISRLKLRPMKSVPSVSQEVAEASPSATSHLSPKNAKEWAGILARNPADVVPAPQNAPPLAAIRENPFRSLQQVIEIADREKSGLVKPGTTMQMWTDMLKQRPDRLPTSLFKGDPMTPAPHRDLASHWPKEGDSWVQ